MAWNTLTSWLCSISSVYARLPGFRTGPPMAAKMPNMAPSPCTSNRAATVVIWSAQARPNNARVGTTQHNLCGSQCSAMFAMATHASQTCHENACTRLLPTCVLPTRRSMT